MDIPANNTVNLSSLLSATVDEIQANSRAVLIYLAIMVGVGGALQLLLGGATLNFFDLQSIASWSSAALGSAAVIGGLVSLFVLVASSYWLLAAMIGRTVTPGFDAILPFAGIWLLSLIAIGFGFLLLVIPGLILITRWVTLLPVVIARDTPAMDSFSASWAMSSGNGWPIFGAYVIFYIALLVVSGVLGGFNYFGGSMGGIVIESLASALSTIGYTALSVGAYRLMRDDKKELTQIFE